MNYCSDCGRRMPNSNAVLCHECRQRRRALGDRSPFEAPYGLTKRNFLLLYSKGMRMCRTAAVFGYLSAASTMIIMFLKIFPYSYYMMIDAFFCLIFTMFIHIVKSRAAAIIFLLYCGGNIAFMVLTGGVFIGYLSVVAAVFGVIGTFHCAIEWRDYLAIWD